MAFPARVMLTCAPAGTLAITSQPIRVRRGLMGRLLIRLYGVANTTTRGIGARSGLGLIGAIVDNGLREPAYMLKRQ